MTSPSAGETPGSKAVMPDFSAVRAMLETHFQQERDYRAGDMISRGQVAPLIERLKKLGWTIAESQLILDKMLNDGDFLVRTLRTSPGKAFMRKVSGDKLIYDRLDRISREAGGQALIRDLVKLPDAERYASMHTARGVPDLLDLLPKDRSGKRRTIKDYDKPTGRIYTAATLVSELEGAYAKATASRKK
jgi:hypothetical protein